MIGTFQEGCFSTTGCVLCRIIPFVPYGYKDIALDIAKRKHMVLKRKVLLQQCLNSQSKVHFRAKYAYAFHYCNQKPKIKIVSKASHLDTV